jgi:ABC-type Fe3+ transport system substrate-binding protein
MHRLRSKRQFLFVGFLTPCLVILAVSLAVSAGQGPGPETEWDKSVKAAEQEGEVMVYVGGAEYREAIQEFQKSFPKIKLSTFSAARGPELLSRLMAERRAGKNVADVYMTGIGTHIALYNAKALSSVRSAMILADVKDQSNWFDGKHKYIYGNDGMAFIFEGAVSRWISINSKQVKEDELKSWWDLARPKWKDKIVSYDPVIPGTAAPALWFFYTNPALGQKYIDELFGKGGVTFSRDYRQLIDWLVAGKASICIACQDEARKAKAQGLPVDEVDHAMREGHLMTHGQGIVSLIQPSPHPNAARVFVNWLLSRQGQLAFQEVTNTRLGYARNSLRTDVPKDKVLREELPRAGEQYFYEGPNSSEERKDSVQALKQAMKK